VVGLDPITQCEQPPLERLDPRVRPEDGKGVDGSGKPKMSSEVQLERHGDGTATIRLNRPEARNALNIATRKALAEACRSIGEDSSVRAVVLTGGPEVFAAGADINEFLDTGAVDMLKRRAERWWQAVADVPQPMIAAVNGFALGGGLELAMCCDIIIAGRSARLGQPEVKVGILPGAGGTQRLTRAIGKFQAMRLVLTGEIISAEEAFTIGLVSKVVDDGKVYDAARATACAIAALPPIAVQQAKEAVILGADASLHTALALERKAVQLTFATADKTEGMRAFLEKRKPEFKGE
jgi:enoyl-CoA hydratase/carnithine racemase